MNACVSLRCATWLALCLPVAAENFESVEKTADDWMKLRVETARIETTWQQERPVLEAMLAALQERASTAEEKRDLAKAKTAKDREEFESLRAKVQTEGDGLRAFDARLKSLCARLEALRAQLPPRLSDALEMSYRSLAKPDLPAAERMQFAMTILNRCGQFNRAITVSEDVLTLPGEPTPKSLQVIYWGLSQAYALDRAKRQAWVGSPTAAGWRWQPVPEIFGSVERLIAVAGDKADPEFVPVPATVARSVATAAAKN